MSRRGLFSAVGVTAVSAVAAKAAPPPRPRIGGGVIDLTHTLTSQFPVWPGNAPFTMVPVTVPGGLFAGNALALWEHTGTHIDAPAHRTRGGATVDAIAATDLIAPLVVLDITARADRDADATVTNADIDAWEKTHGRIPDRAFVAMRSGWDRRLANPGAFVNLDAAGTPHAPGFSAKAAEFLVTQRRVVGVGVDTLSLDTAASKDFGAHTAVLGAGRYGVEALANLATVPPAGATVVVGAPKHLGGTAGPCRVLAFT